jgi:hypothetical protein
MTWGAVMLFDIVATLGGAATATLGGVAVPTLGGAVCLPIILVSLGIMAKCLIFAEAKAGMVRPSCSKRLAAARSI